MTTIYKSSLAIMLLGIAFAFQTISAQDLSIISDSIFSNALNEQRSIKIRLPDEYKPGSTEKYDVVYMLDGEWNINNFAFIYKFARDEKYLPPLILVALPNTYTSDGNMRDRDFLPEKMKNNTKAGGADNFLTFLKNEVIPYINKKFPTSGDNSLFGHSYGGLFTMYVLLKEPDLFSNYYCSDPAFQWNDQRMVNLATKILENTPSLDKTLWINGIESTYKFMGMDKMDAVLKAKAPKNLRWKITYYPNETHNSVRLKGIYDGLKFVYSSYSSKSITFHPMNGSLLEGKPTRVFIMGTYSNLRYTTDGSEPDSSSKPAPQFFLLSGPAKLVLKSIDNNKKYNTSTKGNFELSKVWPATPTLKKANSGGLRYAYYEGKWDSLPDFSKLKPILTGTTDSTFNLKKFPARNHFGCIMEGYIKIDLEGYYLFALSSDDGTKMFLNGREIINNDGKHGADMGKSYVAPLQKGFYPIRIEYFQGDGDSQFNFQYLLPNKMMPEEVPYSTMYN